MMVMLAGLPGTGKSTLVRALAERLPASAIVSKDLIRAAIFDPHLTPYSAAQDDFIMELMLHAAASHLRGGISIVFLDGRTFSREYQRQRVREFAASIGTETRIIECVCVESVVLSRIAASRTHPAVNRTVDLYHRSVHTFAPVPEPKLRIDTGRPLDQCVAEAIACLTAASSRSR